MPQPAGMPASFTLPASDSPDGAQQTMTWANSVGAGDVLGGYVNNSYDWIGQGDGPGPDAFAMIAPGFGNEVSNGFKNSWSFMGWGSTGHNTWQSPYQFQGGSFVATLDGGSPGGQGAWRTFAPAPVIPLIPDSMLIALTDAVVGWLNALQINVTPVFPLSFTATREYRPIKDLTQLPDLTTSPPASPLVQIFPNDDPEDRGGLNQESFEGTFEVAVVVLAKVGQPNPQSPSVYRAIVDSLMNLRQSLRDACRPQGVIVAYGARPAKTLYQGSAGLSQPIYRSALDGGYFLSEESFRFKMVPS